MSKTLTERAAKGVTQVLLVLWVGGLWWISLLLPFLLGQVGLAHALIGELMRGALPMMAAIALVCMGLQTLLLPYSKCASARVLRLLLVAALACLVTLGLGRSMQWGSMMLYSSVIASFAGLLLVLALPKT